MSRAGKLLSRATRITRNRPWFFAALSPCAAAAMFALVLIPAAPLLSQDRTLAEHSVSPILNAFALPERIHPAHVAVVLDGTERGNGSLVLFRSLSHYAVGSTLKLHLVSPPTLITSVTRALQGRAELAHYPISRCRALVAPVWHMAPDASLADLCAPFLAEIVTARAALVVSAEVVVAADVAPCFLEAASGLPNQALFALPHDRSDTCVTFPDQCYPLAFEWTPIAHKPERKPYALGTAVALFDLKRMREQQFSKKLVRASIATWRQLGHREASRGAADLLNNFARLYPDTVAADLPCNCDPLIAGKIPKDNLCSSPPLLVRADTTSFPPSQDAVHLPYYAHLKYFSRSRHDPNSAEEDAEPLDTQNDTASSAPRPSRRHAPGCPHQSHRCGDEDAAHANSLDISILWDTVYVLTRTSGRPFYFAAAAKSVTEQTHPRVEHIVATDDANSFRSYLQGHPGAFLLSSNHDSFDPKAVCHQCKGANGRCATAPSLDQPHARQAFFDCYCSTAYPMNSYMNDLQRRVRNGWVLYLDDDNLLVDRFALSGLLARALGRDALLAFRAYLGRQTPNDAHWASRQVVMGDFDAANFAFHSRHLAKATWPDRRCGDFRVGARLARQLPVAWTDAAVAQANPLRAALGGLGARADAPAPAVTVVMTGYRTEGWRPGWLRAIIREYTSPALKHLVARVVLVWNNLENEIPERVLADADVQAATTAGRFVIVRPTTNSLNHRWVATLPHVETDAVLNLDDDVFVRADGLVCLLSWIRREPARMVGPFVRRIERGGKYILDELLDGSAYSVVLPRILLVPTRYMRAYARAEHSKLRAYVDEQEAHCDDIGLNIVALAEGRKPPLRVLLPERSVVDFYSSCWPRSRRLTGGLGLQKGRGQRRSECVRELMRMYRLHRFKNAEHTATCLARGNAVAKKDYVHPERYGRMKELQIECDQETEG